MILHTGTYLHKRCYKIVSKIGQGGFGITYLAEETGYFKATGFGEQYIASHHPDTVVVKELFFDDFCSRNDETGLVFITNTNKKIEFEKLVNKQLEEGRILKNLNHQNIVNTLDIFKENDTAYMVLDYIDGISLEELVKKEGKLSRDQAMEYITAILSALSYIHEKKVLHLDIKPSNILIKKSDNQPILIDFGASQTYGVNSEIESTTSKLVAGISHGYAPFEQNDLDNIKKFDATFDTYAACATLYFMLTGTPPPRAGYILSEREKLVPASTLNTTVDATLDAILAKGMSMKYSSRYHSAAALLNAIQNPEADTKEEAPKPPDKETGLWEMAISKNEIPAFKRYIAAYPEGKYSEEAKAKLKELEEENIWLETDKEDVSSLEKYLQTYPGGKHVSEAKEAIRKLEGTRFITDETVWNEAAKKNTADSYQYYLKQFPNGKYKEEARKRMDQLKLKDSKTEVKKKDTGKSIFIGAFIVVLLLLIAVPYVYKFSKNSLDNDGRSLYQLSKTDTINRLQYLTKASDAGFDSAQYDLGQVYYYGTDGVSQNDTTAVSWYQMASRQPHAEAQYSLGFMYENGKGGLPENDSMAVYWYQKAADLGNAGAEYNLGRFYENGKGGLVANESQCVYWYRRAANQGYDMAENKVGVMYQNGENGLSKSDTTAKYWYEKAAEQGNEYAEFNLGYFYDDSRGGSIQDNSKAVYWYEKAAEQGNASAQINLGVMYEYGKGGLAQNNTTAAYWYHKSAEQGNQYGKGNYGVMLYEGKGVAKDMVAGKQLIKEAAESLGNATTYYSDYLKNIE